MDSLIVVTYHYLREKKDAKGLSYHGLAPDEFVAHVRGLLNKYRPVTAEEIHAFLKGELPSGGPDGFYLTFDDGLAEHYSVAFSIMKDLGVQGSFFIPGRILNEKTILSTHKTHTLSALLGDEEFARIFVQKAQESVGAFYLDEVAPLELARRQTRWGSDLAKQCRYYINYVIQPALKDELLRQMFLECIGPEEEFFPHIYLNSTELRVMQEGGMDIGGHSYAHQALASLPDDAQAEDVRLSKVALDLHLGKKSRSFSYPFGKGAAFNALTVEFLKQNDFYCGYSTEYGMNHPGGNPYAIKRLDANDIKNMI